MYKCQKVLNITDICKYFCLVDLLQYMWRWTDKGQLAGGAYPAHTARLFPSLDGVKKVDAAFERESDGAIIFISG